MFYNSKLLRNNFSSTCAEGLSVAYYDASFKLSNSPLSLVDVYEVEFDQLRRAVDAMCINPFSL